jgi:acylphosphatase
MIHVYISGTVQGVGFRQFIKSKARKNNIRGWVKNLPDGRVEAVFEGSREDLEKMYAEAKKGPFLAQVKDFQIEEIEDANFDNFEVIK